MQAEKAIDERNGELVLRALRERRSIGRVAPTPVPRHVIEQVIAAAGWAPNHHRTNPWRFVVIAGAAREELGKVMAASLRARLDGSDEENYQDRLERERRKPLRAPAIIAVAAAPPESPKAIEIEEIAAVAAGVENMLLAAEALGLGAVWRTGKPAYDPAVKRFLGLPEAGHLLAFVYLGYPDMPDLPERARETAPYTTWLGWDVDGESFRDGRMIR